MRPIGFLIVVAMVMAASMCAQAKIGTCDTVPAATLLLPYFEVDLANEGYMAQTTVLCINNGSASAVIAQVSLWTDYGVPTTAFDVSLAGNGVFSLNLRNIFDGLTVGGVDFSTQEAELVAAHTGLASPGTGLSSGYNHGDEIARGYVVVNAMNQTGAGFPTEVGYFVMGGNGKASNQNVLWGDYLFVDPANNFSQGDTLVHIEASGVDPNVTTPGMYTFFGAFVSGTAADNREPLGTSWAVNFDVSDSYRPSDIVYWRDPKVVTTPVNPWALPAWFPLSQTTFALHDEAGATHAPASSHLLPLACGRLDVSGDDVDSPYDKGWILLDLDSTTSGPLFGTTRQSWVSSVRTWEGRFSVGHGATLLADAGSRKGAPKAPDMEGQN